MFEAGFKFIDLFAGIGGIRLGFESADGECVYSSEWDKSAQDTYEANFGERPDGDITEVEPLSIPDHDILLGGFPCQAFSICGDQKGFQDTRGTLFFNIEQIIRVKKPKAFMLENVKNLRSHDQGRTFKTILKSLSDLGYHVHHTVLNALDFGVPQKRERTIIVGFLDNFEFNFPAPIPLSERASIGDILEPEDDIDPKHWASEHIRARRKLKLPNPPSFPTIWHENKSGNISALPYSCALRAGASYNYLLINGERRPTPRELLRIQGFPDTFKIAVPHGQLRKQAGNSVAVPVMEAVAASMLESLKGEKMNTQDLNLLYK